MSEHKPSPELQALMDFDLLSAFPSAEQIADAVKSSMVIAMTEAFNEVFMNNNKEGNYDR